MNIVRSALLAAAQQRRAADVGQNALTAKAQEKLIAYHRPAAREREAV